MIQAYLITTALAVALAYGAGWQTNQWRHDSEQKHKLEQAALEQQELSRLEQARSRAALDAQVMARKSEARLRSDAAASQSALVGLQDDSSRALRAAATSLAACTAISNTYDQLLTDSERRYRELAVKTDQHVIDLRVQLETP